MSLKKIAAISFVFAMVMGIFSSSFAEPTEDFHVEPSTEATTEASGPVVEEYKVYVDDSKRIEPGSLSGDVNLNTVGKGLYFDGQDFYFFTDTGVMASNYMFNIDGDRFFFGEDGKMVKDQIVNYNGEVYYFDINGAMYKNRWYSLEEVDTYENTITYTDYYFGPTGRAYRAGDGSNSSIIVKTIEGQKFGFDTEGAKVEGYYDEEGTKHDPDEDPAFANCIYYFDPDDNGAAATGWHYYEGATRMDEYDSEEELVLYFDTKTCRKVAAKSSSAYPDRCISRIIEGQRYMFDSNGVRKNKWYKTEYGNESNPQRASRSNLKYFSEEYDGYLSKGWFLAVPGIENDHYNEGNKFGLQLDVNVKRHKDDEEMWFYAGSNGNILRKTIRKIGNYVYAFDDDGVMQQDALVRVQNGNFIKAYQTEYLNKANVLFDPNETGGNADPDPYGVSDPINLDPKKGILDVRNKEQWMYFLGDVNGEDKVGSRSKLNTPFKVELNDDDVYFVCSSTGGYTMEDTDGGTSATHLTEVVNRNKKLIQNGVLLKPNPDNNNYGVVRYARKAVDFAGKNDERIGSIINHHARQFTSDLQAKKYVVVKSGGEQVMSEYVSFKDKNGNYIYIGSDGNFLGVYPYQGTFHKNPLNKTGCHWGDNPTGAEIPVGTSYYWTYRDSDKKIQYGLPPKDDLVDSSYLWLNFANEDVDGNIQGPYVDGYAQFMYDDTTP